jgi:hypothetical protein
MLPGMNDVFKAFGYTLSLPERLVRSLAAALGGTTKLVTDIVIPEPLRKSSTYTAIMGNTQRFLIEKVAQVQGAYANEAAESLPEDFIPRKVAGNVIDAVGIFSLHLSPLWVFAIATDVASGSKEYLGRLTAELKSKNVIPADASIRKLDDLLDSMSQAGADSARVFDAPPLDAAAVRELRDRLAGGYTNVFKNATNLVPRIDDMWKQMESLARRDGVAVDTIVGLMTIDLGKTAGRAIDAAFSVGAVTTDLRSEKIFTSYGQTIEQIQREGALTVLERSARPFVDAIGAHMGGRTETWTEWALGKLWPWKGDVNCGGVEAPPP